MKKKRAGAGGVEGGPLDLGPSLSSASGRQRPPAREVHLVFLGARAEAGGSERRRSPPRPLAQRCRRVDQLAGRQPHLQQVEAAMSLARARKITGGTRGKVAVERERRSLGSSISFINSIVLAGRLQEYLSITLTAGLHRDSHTHAYRHVIGRWACPVIHRLVSRWGCDNCPSLNGRLVPNWCCWKTILEDIVILPSCILHR